VDLHMVFGYETWKLLIVGDVGHFTYNAEANALGSQEARGGVRY